MSKMDTKTNNCYNLRAVSASKQIPRNRPCRAYACAAERERWSSAPLAVNRFKSHLILLLVSFLFVHPRHTLYIWTIHSRRSAITTWDIALVHTPLESGLLESGDNQICRCWPIRDKRVFCSPQIVEQRTNFVSVCAPHPSPSDNTCRAWAHFAGAVARSWNDIIFCDSCQSHRGPWLDYAHRAIWSGAVR